MSESSRVDFIKDVKVLMGTRYKFERVYPMILPNYHIMLIAFE